MLQGPLVPCSSSPLLDSNWPNLPKSSACPGKVVSLSRTVPKPPGAVCVPAKPREKYCLRVRDIPPHAWLEGDLNPPPLISRIVVTRLCIVDSTWGFTGHAPRHRCLRYFTPDPP